MPEEGGEREDEERQQGTEAGNREDGESARAI